MTHRTNTALDLARMMIRQARMLKKAGLAAEARALARRALDWHAMGHMAARPVPVRIHDRRR